MARFWCKGAHAVHLVCRVRCAPGAAVRLAEVSGLALRHLLARLAANGASVSRLLRYSLLVPPGRATSSTGCFLNKIIFVPLMLTA